MHGFDTPKNHVHLVRGFLLDNCVPLGYCGHMLSGIRIFSSDGIWRQILTDLNATVLDAPNTTDLNLDDMDLPGVVSPMELKALLLNASDNSHVLQEFFGTSVSLPYIQGRLVVALYKSGGMTSPELKVAMGYASDTSTHTVDTAIYQLRRRFGRDFIINNNGVYKLGRV